MPTGWVAALGLVAVTSMAYVVICVFHRPLRNAEFEWAVLALVAIGLMVLMMTLPMWFPAQD